MWISHKAKDGDTLQTIAKKYKNKDPNAILLYPRNKQIAATLKSGGPLKKGQVVWVLDPRAKCYIVKKNGKKVVLDEKEYQKFRKDVDKKMDEMLERQRLNYNYAIDRHDAQIAINKEQWFVSSVVSAFSSVEEPDWKPARAAFDKMKATVNARDYKGFEKAAINCENVVTQYTNDVHNWISGLISTAEGSVKNLVKVREVGKFCGVLATVTIAAPAGIMAGMLVGAGANAGVGLLYDGSENVSLAANGMKTRSASEIGKRMLANAAAGAAGAAIAGKLVGLVKGPFIKLITKNAFIKKQAVTLAKTIIPKRVIDKQVARVLADKEVQAMIAEATKKGTIHIDQLHALIGKDTVIIECLTRFLVRAGTGAFSKHFGVGKFIHDYVLSFVRTAPTELAKGQSAAVDAVAKNLVKSGAADAFFADFMKANMKDFEAELNTVLKEKAQQAVRKMG